MKEALKLALEFIERVNKDGWILADFEPQMYTTITAIKAALAQQDHSEQHLDMVKAQPAQEPVAYGMGDTMIGRGNRMMYVRLDKGQDGCTIPLYTTPQPEERNFCSRCGKRTADLTVIHTCTPPQENT
jgi:hypothetical protein